MIGKIATVLLNSNKDAVSCLILDKVLFANYDAENKTYYNYDCYLVKQIETNKLFIVHPSNLKTILDNTDDAG